MSIKSIRKKATHDKSRGLAPEDPAQTAVSLRKRERLSRMSLRKRERLIMRRAMRVGDTFSQVFQTPIQTPIESLFAGRILCCCLLTAITPVKPSEATTIAIGPTGIP